MDYLAPVEVDAARADRVLWTRGDPPAATAVFLLLLLACCFIALTWRSVLFGRRLCPATETASAVAAGAGGVAAAAAASAFPAPLSQTTLSTAASNFSWFVLCLS